MTIAIMLALLAIDPHQLATISASISSTQWRHYSFVLFSLSIIAWIVSLVLVSVVLKLNRVGSIKPKSATSTTANISSAQTKSLALTLRHSIFYLSNEFFDQQNCMLTPAITRKANPKIKSVYLTPMVVLKRYGLVCLSMMCVAIFCFWLAVIANTLSQRLSHIEVVPKNEIYIDAVITPVGLSDRRLEFERLSSKKVAQGYRQLVILSDIKPATANNFTNSLEDNNVKDSTPITKDNPFAISSPHHPSTSKALSLDSNNDLNNNSYNDSYNHKTINLDEDDTSNANQLTVEQIALDKTIVMLHSYKLNKAWLNQLAPNQQLKVRLKLVPIAYDKNSSDFNEYRWLSSRHAIASAYLVDASESNKQRIKTLTIRQKINLYRFKLRQHFLSLTPATLDSSNQSLASRHSTEDASTNYLNPNQLSQHLDAKAVTLSLLTGDRSLISKDMTGLYRFAGISHLLAISGAHVLFLAILASKLASMLLNRFYPRLYGSIPRWQIKMSVAILVAFTYALFAGFDVPAVRTAAMLSIVALSRYMLMTISVYKTLLILAVIMALHDVFNLWQAGYWLSFVAVAMLIIYSRHWEKSNKFKQDLNNIKTPNKSYNENLKLDKFRSLIKGFIHLQFWMSMALLPISIWLFGKVSLWGLLVNLIAIGFFGWIVVPLNLLAGVVYAITPNSFGLADLIWQLIIWLLLKFHSLLYVLQSSVGQAGWLHTEIEAITLIFMLMVVLPWLLPKGIISRYLTIPGMAVLCILPFKDLVTTHQPQIKHTTIDVINTKDSQLSALLVRHEDSAWLFLADYTHIKYNKSSTNKTYMQLRSPTNVKRSNKVTQAIYDALKHHSVDALTGIIGQTATPNITNIVIGLRTDMPISYYWQAGYIPSLNSVDKSDSLNSLNSINGDISDVNKQVETLKSLGLSTQSCQSGKYWNYQMNNSQLTVENTTDYMTKIESNEKAENAVIDGSNFFKISTLTGWPKIADRAVWDCTLKINSQYPIIFNTDSTQQPQTIAKAKEGVIIYASAQSKLAELWQLMCTNNFKGIGSDNITTTQSPHMVSNQHWIFHPTAKVDLKLVDAAQPKSWTIADNPHRHSVSDSLTEAQLYWQQNIKN